MLTNLSLHVSSGSNCTSAIVGSRVYGDTLPPLLTIALCGQFSCRGQSIDYALALVTIARDSESEQLFFNRSTVFTEGCSSANASYPVCLLKGILINSNLPVTC